MSQFYASIQGNRGEATRMGSKESGIGGHVRGWTMGCSTRLSYDKNTDEDTMGISLTGGSNDADHPRCYIEAVTVNGRAHISKIDIDGYLAVPGNFTDEQRTAILVYARMLGNSETK